MASGAVRTALGALAVTVLAAACSGADRPRVTAAATSEPVVPAESTTPSTEAAAPAEVAPAVAAAAPAPTTTTTAAPVRLRAVHEQAWTPFATVGGITLQHPSRRGERVGFHQSNHEGAQEMTVLTDAAAPLVLETRERLTSARTAADVVVDPAVEIRSPVTGTVKRAGTYTLYCKYSDDYLVVEPDSHPGWEVKMLHISGVAVRKGQRVVAGQTLVAPMATPLPFESQVDEHRTADPAWPHVHIEVVDPSIPNKPSPGGGCP